MRGLRSPMTPDAEAGGFGPPVAGLTVRCLTTWLHLNNGNPPSLGSGQEREVTSTNWLQGRELNPRHPGYEPDDLPLIYPAVFTVSFSQAGNTCPQLP
jgi:hypothetical protein